MNKILLIFFGCGLGGVARYLVGNATHLLCGQKFPYGTLLVNVSGSFLIGLLFTVISERYFHSDYFLGPLLLVGFLGGYTTFSSFSLETITLLKMGNYWAATLNIFLSVGLCLGATILGIALAKI
jgi:fluoride exporter